MKKILIVLIAGLLLYACGNNKADTAATGDDSTEINFSWEAMLNDSTGRLEMIKKEGMTPDSLSAQSMIDFLNSKNQFIRIEFIKISGDTLFTKIPEATYLTQQMGSSGPTLFFAEAVYNLTEIPGIRFVNFDFEEGDHASPGVFNRDTFKDQ
jgi:hypothetical protein